MRLTSLKEDITTRKINTPSKAFKATKNIPIKDFNMNNRLLIYFYIGGTTSDPIPKNRGSKDRTFVEPLIIFISESSNMGYRSAIV